MRIMLGMLNRILHLERMNLSLKTEIASLQADKLGLQDDIECMQRKYYVLLQEMLPKERV